MPASRELPLDQVEVRRVVSKQVTFSAAGNESSVDVKLDVKSVHKPIVAASSVVKKSFLKGLASSQSSRQSASTAVSSDIDTDVVARPELKRDVFMLPAKMVYGDVCPAVDERGNDDDGGRVVNDKDSEESEKAYAKVIPKYPGF